MTFAYVIQVCFGPLLPTPGSETITMSGLIAAEVGAQRSGVCDGDRSAEGQHANLVDGRGCAGRGRRGRAGELAAHFRVVLPEARSGPRDLPQRRAKSIRRPGRFERAETRV